MLKTVTMFQRDHEKFMKLIEDGTLPQPSMHFVTGPVHLGKEGEEEIINDVYFHTFDVDRTNKQSTKFFEAISNIVDDRMADDAKDRMMFDYHPITGTFVMIDTVDRRNNTLFEFDRTFNLMLSDM
jgi:hypothetical protein